MADGFVVAKPILYYGLSSAYSTFYPSMQCVYSCEFKELVCFRCSCQNSAMIFITVCFMEAVLPVVYYTTPLMSFLSDQLFVIPVLV